MTVPVFPTRFVLLAFAAVLACAAPGPARAQAPTGETVGREAILVDSDTGAILFEKDADKRMPPASMSKIMTTYMVYQRMRENRVKMDDTFTTSENAWRKGGAKTGGSTMFLNPGERAKVEDLLRGSSSRATTPASSWPRESREANASSPRKSPRSARRSASRIRASPIPPAGPIPTTT